MKIYTSYFGNQKNIPEDIVKISISLRPPKWYDGICYRKIAPNDEILDDWNHGRKDQEAKEHYERVYFFKVLRKLNPKEILDELEKLSNGKDIVLLCFEKPKEFCHRHLFADWIKNSLNIEIKEL